MAKFLQNPGADSPGARPQGDEGHPQGPRPRRPSGPASPAHSRDIDNLFGFILRDAGKGAIIDGDTKELVAWSTRASPCTSSAPRRPAATSTRSAATGRSA